MDGRPTTRGRPPTSTGGPSTSQGEFAYSYDYGPSYTGQTSSSQFTDETDDDDEDVFAFLPPATADASSAKAPPTADSAYPAPATPPSTNSTANPSHPNDMPMRRLDSRGQTTQSTQPSTHIVDLHTAGSEKDGTPAIMPKSAGTITPTESLVLSNESREGSIKMEFDFDAIDEEDSPFPEVRASVSNVDDPDMPSLTFRMWVVGLVSCLFAGSLNVFFNFRQPAPGIASSAMLILAHPFGKFLALVLPITTYRIPFPHLPVSWAPKSTDTPPNRVSAFFRSIQAALCTPTCLEFSLNPGPWNIKEHVLVYMMANVAVSTPYSLNAIVVSEIYYGASTSYWFALTLTLATQLIGFGIAGFTRRFLVWPASMVWPPNLVSCTILNTLHAEEEIMYDDADDGPRPKRYITRYKFFLIVFIGIFFYSFLPGFAFKALSYFTFICWAAPNNVPVNLFFGSASGLGMSFITFDWAQISWIGSPLMVPWWAQVHVMIGFVLFFWILAPVLYLTGAWNMWYFPFSMNQPFDRFGNVYNVTQVLTADAHFDPQKYAEYSPLFLPTTYAITYLLAFALATAVIVHTLLYHGRALYAGVRKMKVEQDDVHAKLMRNYPEVPDWWYGLVFVVFFSLGIVAVEVWDTTVPVWALLLSVILPIVYILPAGFIFAMTGQSITLNLLAQIIPGTMLPGNPLANMIFKSFSVQTLSESINFTQDLKLGHYIKVPPRSTFLVQGVATILASFVQIGVKYWIFDAVDDICDRNQPAQLTCPHNKVFYTASAIWGVVGPDRQFGAGSMYNPVLYALVIGVFLPIPFYLYQRRYPTSWVKYVSIPVLLNGPAFIPPATGINYSSWFLVGFIFQYWIRKRAFAWWSKFNYVTSGALDTGSVFGLIFIFFALQLPKNGAIEEKANNWWGNQVFVNTADYQGTAYKPIPEGGVAMPNWPPKS